MTVSVMDAFVIQLEQHCDKRGSFQELLSRKVCPEFNCVQINCSVSKKGVLRGIHINEYAKLVYCVRGSVFDVVVDTRHWSKTFGKWHGVELNQNNAIYIPPHCGHGFLSLEEDSILIYAQDGFYNEKNEWSVRYDDPTLNIAWLGQPLIISEKDMNAPLLIDYD